MADREQAGRFIFRARKQKVCLVFISVKFHYPEVSESWKRPASERTDINVAAWTFSMTV